MAPHAQRGLRRVEALGSTPVCQRGARDARHTRAHLHRLRCPRVQADFLRQHPPIDGVSWPRRYVGRRLQCERKQLQAMLLWD